ncbi:hypothetical protein Q3G72_003701 [Acer saccharum]|nr:hypothetical protein Q3G72_003701 [Acer saccharum]
MRPWCKARVPLLYNFIQSHYWQVGFLSPSIFSHWGFQESNEGQDFTPVLSSSGTEPKSSSKKNGFHMILVCKSSFLVCFIFNDIAWYR